MFIVPAGVIAVYIPHLLVFLINYQPPPVPSSDLRDQLNIFMPHYWDCYAKQEYFLSVFNWMFRLFWLNNV